MKGTITINVNVNLTFSKIMAFILSSMIFYLDLKINKDGRSMLLEALPYIAILVTGKQVADIWKQSSDKITETVIDTPEKTVTETISESTSNQTETENKI